MRPRPYPSPAGCMGRPGLSGTVSRERFRHNSGLQEYLQASENCVCQGARRSATTLREAKASDGTASTKRLSVMSATAIERPLRQRLLSVSDRLFAAVFCSRYAPLAYMLTAPVAEAYFFLLSRRFMRRHAAAPHGTHSMDQDATDAIRFWELQAAEDPSGIKPLLRGWFVGEPALEAKRGNLIEFLAWSTFNKTPECCGRAQRAVIDSLLERLETAAGHELAPPGYEPNLKAMTFTLDPWPTSCCKPLVAYLALQIARQLLACFLHAHGFEVRLAHDMLIMGPFLVGCCRKTALRRCRRALHCETVASRGHSIDLTVPLRAVSRLTGAACRPPRLLGASGGRQPRQARPSAAAAGGAAARCARAAAVRPRAALPRTGSHGCCARAHVPPLVHAVRRRPLPHAYRLAPLHCFSTGVTANAHARARTRTPRCATIRCRRAHHFFPTIDACTSGRRLRALAQARAHMRPPR